MPSEFSEQLAEITTEPEPEPVSSPGVGVGVGVVVVVVVGVSVGAGVGVGVGVGVRCSGGGRRVRSSSLEPLSLSARFFDHIKQQHHQNININENY